MKMRKILAMILVLAMALSLTITLTACGDEPVEPTGAVSDVPTGDPDPVDDPKELKPVKIGIINFLYGTRGMNAAEAYMEYLEANFPVEFELVTCASTDAESNIASTENLLTSGADVILSYVCDGAVQCTKLCEEADAYFGLMMCKEYEEDVAELTASDYYLGSIHPEHDAYAFAQELAALFMNEGFKNFVTVGFNIGLVRENDKLCYGFQDYVTENGGTIVTTINESVMSLSEATTTMVANYGDQIDYIFAPAAGANFVLPRITGTDIKICVNDVPNNTAELFSTGNLHFIYELPYECIGIMTVLAINAVNGIELAGTPEMISIESKYALLHNADDVASYLELTQLGEDGIPLYTAEELAQFISSSASWDDLMAMCASNRLEDIAARQAG